MAVAVYRQCRYDGGFEGMKASQKATLTLSADRVELRRPRVFFGSRRTNIMRIWARWTAVIDLDVRAGRDGTRLLLTTKARGTARIVVPGAEPLDIWRALDQTDVRERIPPRVRKALDGDGQLEEPADDEEAGEALAAVAGDEEGDAAEGDAPVPDDAGSPAAEAAPAGDAAAEGSEGPDGDGESAAPAEGD